MFTQFAKLPRFFLHAVLSRERKSTIPTKTLVFFSSSNTSSKVVTLPPKMTSGIIKPLHPAVI